MKKNFQIHRNYYKLIFKKHILKIISKSLGQNIKSVKSIYLSQDCFFGNQIQILNNIIFMCEILDAKKLF